MQVKRRVVGPLTAGLTALLLSLSACTHAGQAAPPTDGIVVDGLASIDVRPVDYGGQRAITAVFGSISPGRDVVLQRMTSNGWQDVATSKQDAYGEVNFVAADEGKDIFRALASASPSQPAVATPQASAGQQWTTAMSSSFSGDTLKKSEWKARGTGSYAASGRHCAAQYPSEITVADGKLQLSVSEESAPENIAKAKNAGCESALVLRNAMISTDGLATFRTGLAAARARFPESRGVRGGIWLQSIGTSDIEMINSYGYGRGLSSALITSGKHYPGSDEDAAVLAEAVKDRAWWSDYHVFSVEWTNTEVIFRIDGELTRRIDRTIPDLDYYLVIGLLSPDSDQAQLAKLADAAAGSQLPQTMSVDWVKVWNRA